MSEKLNLNSVFPALNIIVVSFSFITVEWVGLMLNQIESTFNNGKQYVNMYVQCKRLKKKGNNLITKHKLSLNRNFLFYVVLTVEKFVKSCEYLNIYSSFNSNYNQK